MTVLPALALALVTLTGACPAACDADPLDLPEVGDDVQDLLEPSMLDPGLEPPEAPVDPTERVPTDPLGLFATFTSTQLPAAEQAELGTAEGLLPPIASPRLDERPSSEAEDASSPPTIAEEHASRDRGGPSAQGQPVHVPASGPQAHGERVDEHPGSVLVSVLVGLGAIGLYHKLSKDRALEHPARRRILELLADEPGLGTGDVARELEVAYRTARHHLEVLARFDLVVQAKRGGCWRWARPEDAGCLDERELPVLQQRLLDELEQEPGLHLSELARRLDAAKATVKHHLDDLDERERVRDERVGPLRRFFPADAEEQASS